MPELARFRAKHDEAAVPPAETTILHVDMDAFFVSVELLERPELRCKHVVVGGRPDQRGVVSAASYEAAKFAPVVEMVSIDEAYLDLAGTERLHGPSFAAAHKLLRTITTTTGLPCSAGLASTRLVAKIASEQAKPRGLLWIPVGQEPRFLAQLPVRKIPGIGEVTERALRALGIEYVHQLADYPQEKLEQIFGQWGTALYRKARGGDSYEFVLDAEPKSISQNHTFAEDTGDVAAMESMLSHLAQKACKRLREAGLSARTLTTTIRYTGFDTYTRSKTLNDPVQFDTNAFAAFLSLFREHRNPKRKVRLIGVALSGLTHENEQLDLLDPERRAKLDKLTRAADSLRDRFGFAKIQFGGSLLTEKPERENERGEIPRFPRNKE